MRDCCQGGYLIGFARPGAYHLARYISVLIGLPLGVSSFAIPFVCNSGSALYGLSRGYYRNGGQKCTGVGRQRYPSMPDHVGGYFGSNVSMHPVNRAVAFDL